MFAETFLVDRLTTMTPYEVFISPGINIDYLGEAHDDIPKLYVGHLGIKLKSSRIDDMFANGYREIDNPEFLMTEINYVCLNSMWPEVRRRIKLAYQNWSPFLDESDYSSLVFIEAKKKGIMGERVWWNEVVGLVMPRIT